MPIIAADKGDSDFSPISANMHHAVCYGVIDIGTQPQVGNFPSRRKVLIEWEVPGERIEFEKDGKKHNLPRAISNRYTLTLASKGLLRPMLESWRGRPFTAEELNGFDVSNLVGANCLLNVIHQNGKGDKANRVYANVGSVNPLMKGMAKLKPENPTVVFSMNDFKVGEGDSIVIPESIPEWIVSLIKQSDEYQSSLHPAKRQPEQYAPATQEQLDEDVPF